MTLEELTNKLQEADKAYYDNSEEIMPDHEYDQLVAEYTKLTGEKWVAFGDSGSVQHKRPMLSLDKARSVSELVKFFSDDPLLIVAPKIDGSSLSLWYDTRGNLVRAITRGKLVAGISYGEDVTSQAKLIETVPHSIKAMGFPVEIRGEVWMSPEDLENANKSREDKFKNSRNAASGILRSESNSSYAKYIRFVAYNAFKQNLPHHEDKWHKNNLDMLAWLEDQKFDVPDTMYTYVSNIADDVEPELQKLKDFMGSCEYPTDGIVLTVSSHEIQRSMGFSSRFPKFAVAYKFETETAQTIIKEIQWTATRTGLVKPKAIFDQVELDGTTVGQATLHNAKNVMELNIAAGDIVEVYKANMIIPQVAKVVTRGPALYPMSAINFGQTHYYLPGSCPSCLHSISWTKTNTDLVCSNQSCPPKIIDLLVYAGSKKNWDIDGLGESVAEALVAQGFVHDLPQLFELENAKVELAAMKIDGITYGNSRAKTLLAGIRAAKDKPWHITLHSLGCPGLGEPECKQIAQTFSLQELLETDQTILAQELGTLKGIGKATAWALVEWIEDNATMLACFLEGFNTAKEEVKIGGSLADKTFCITGKHSVPRDILVDLIESNGGTVVSAVSKKLDYLVAGEDAGSKLEKATKLGVKTIDEDALRCLVSET